MILCNTSIYNYIPVYCIRGSYRRSYTTSILLSPNPMLRLPQSLCSSARLLPARRLASCVFAVPPPSSCARLPTIRASRTLCTKAAPKAAEAAAKAAAEAAPKATEAAAEAAGGFSYLAFAKAFPITNNLIIATMKTSAADLVAQCAMEKKSFSEIDWQRNLVFAAFGFAYLGLFQYWYQVNIFTRLFPGVNKFTSQPWAAKLTDLPGLAALAGQIVLDLGMLSFCYLPTFYVFKAGVFSDSWDAMSWVNGGLGNYMQNFSKDVYDVVRVWGPADLLCFSVPLYLRLPIRHIVSFVWTAYLSFVRGAKH